MGGTQTRCTVTATTIAPAAYRVQEEVGEGGCGLFNPSPGGVHRSRIRGEMGGNGERLWDFWLPDPQPIS